MSRSNRNLRMVNTSSKAETVRSATAKAKVRLDTATLELIRQSRVPKGDVVSVSQSAGILAAKQTPNLIPLCHPVLLDSVEIDVDTSIGDSLLEITATVSGTGRTGYEMEALVAASVAALNLYDMCKAVDRGMTIEELRLTRKSGGDSGTYEVEPASRRKGRVVEVCLGEDRGPKSPVEQGVLEEGVGFVGDSHAGTARQVSLLAIETIGKFAAALEKMNPTMMRSSGVEIRPGDSAENLLVEGIDLVSLPVGTWLKLGSEAIIEVIQIGKQFHKPGFFLLPMEGVFGRVVRGGKVMKDDEVVVCENPPNRESEA